jgi:hypothetical protein
VPNWLFLADALKTSSCDHNELNDLALVHTNGLRNACLKRILQGLIAQHCITAWHTDQSFATELCVVDRLGIR